MDNERRANFAKFGAVATTVGSAVGLGNIWRFPYEAGVNGGGAFMICYLVFLFMIGVPVMIAEFLIGRHTRSNEFYAFRNLAPGKPWWIIGIVGIIASLTILSFYSVVAGWTVEYLIQSLSGQLSLPDQESYHIKFVDFSTSGSRSILWTLIFLSVNAAVLLAGVTKGIERVSKLLMPLLFALMIVLCVNSLMLPGASDGLKFLFKPDFSKINASVLLSAMGQAFFSLSLGLGCMMTYGSYFSSDTRLGRTASTTAVLDAMVAILAGTIIFPAVFSFGASPAAGPTLVFEVLPNIFNHMPMGVVWSTIFFFLLVMASLTSTISMSEISISYLIEKHRMTRRTAVLVSSAVAVVFGSLCALSFGSLEGVKVFGMTIFNLFDYASSNVMLPIGGFFTSIFAGWIIDKKILRSQLTNDGSIRFRLIRVVTFCIRWPAPLAILLIMLNSLGLI